jgi:hypothetical protein
MKTEKCSASYADGVQLAYAKILDIVAHVVIVALALGYVVYLFRILPLDLPIEAVAGNWHLSSTELASNYAVHNGWSCFSGISPLLHGDAISYASIVILAMATTICLLTAIVMYLRGRNLLYAIMALLQVLVLSVAASGLLYAGR